MKSLLLGSAAGLVVVSTGQAANLPVKAKPVEYVKVCSLYGSGFYYMPGTDICLKIGGYVRAETVWGGNGNFVQGPIQGDVNNRLTSNLVMRGRAYITADAREQTAFGTARGYVSVGVATLDIGNAVLPSNLGFNRAFIQWAGITAGVTQSFYDFYSGVVSYRGYNPFGDTADIGWWLWGYTAQLGNGVTATISAEQRRTTQICDFIGTTLISGLSGAGGCLTNGDVLVPQGSGGVTGNSAPLGYGGLVAPDIVGNIRIDQTWGGAQVMAAVHNDNAVYYSNNPAFGGPSNKWGFVVGAGLRLNFPMVAQGDYFQTQVNYTQGALRYLSTANFAPTLAFMRGNNLSYGLMTDCVYGASAAAAGTPAAGFAVSNPTGCNLTTGWGVNASYEHYWTPQFHESFVFGYMGVKYNDQANGVLCFAEGAGTVGGGALAVARPGCNNDWAVWSGSTRFQYDVTKSFYLGVEFLYQRYATATQPGDVAGGLAAFGGGVVANNGLTAETPLKDQNNLAVTARIHKDFLP